MALLLLRLGALLAGLVASLASDASPVVWSSSDRIRLECVLPPGRFLQARKPPPPLEADIDEEVKILYNWTKNNESIGVKRISADGSLEVRRREGSGNVYQCSVRKHGGVVLGYPQTVKFSYIAKQFKLQPNNTVVMIGQPAMLSCNIESEPAASYVWSKNNTILTTDTRIYFIKNQLLITEVTEEDTGSYRCIATNPSLNKSRTSFSGQLTVDPHLTNVKPRFLPGVDQQMQQAVELNGTAILTCPVLGYPRPEIMWEFRPLSDGRSMELDAVSQVLERPQFSSDQEGTYVCSIMNRNLKKIFTLLISEPVNISYPPLPKEPRRASTVRFNCNGTGNPEPLISWYKDGKPIEYSSRIRLLTAIYENNLRQLVISSVTTDDAGIYQCFVSNSNSQTSQWAILSVPGDGGPKPQGLKCFPINATAAKLSWTSENQNVVAYTVHTMKSDRYLSHGPIEVTEKIVTLNAPLTEEQFQVRAYVTGTASDMSDPVACRGQGVPIQLTRHKWGVMVSWEEFSRDMPGIKQWKLEVSSKDKEAKTITLDGNVTSYNITLGEEESANVRVLATKTLEWPDDDYSLVTWTPTSHATGRPYSPSETPPVPKNLEAKKVTANSVSLRWNKLDGPYTYTVCVRRPNHLRDPHAACQDSKNPWTLVSNLTPDTEYEATVQARSNKLGDFSEPFVFVTNSEVSSRFTYFNYTFVNSSTIKVSWAEIPPTQAETRPNYTIHYSPILKLPVEEWNTLTVHENFILLTEIEPKDKTYVMVTAYDPVEHTTILTIPQPVEHAAEVKKNQLTWQYTTSGLLLEWSDSGRSDCEVRWSQNITLPVETWQRTQFYDHAVTLAVADTARATFVSVRCGAASNILTVPGLPRIYNVKQQSSLYLGIGVGCAVCLIVVLTVAAIICIRNKHKPARTRRRRISDGLEGEGAELKSVGGRLANGAGRPLLNGHVHITENPAVSKTPNGKIIKARYEAFDMSRPDNLDITTQTTLEPDTSARCLLDTTRHSQHSFNKLPDDNMNSEITQFRDNSTSQPTLQPNG